MRCAVLLSVFVLVSCEVAQVAPTYVVLVGPPVIHPGHQVVTFDPQARQLPCSCTNNVCKCCVPINIPQISVNEQGCLSTIYDSDNLAISISFQFGDRVIFNQTLSASNPPPICYPIPQLPMVVVCLRLYKIKLVDGGIYTCIKVEIQLLLTPILILNFDCVQITGSGITSSKPVVAPSRLPTLDVRNAWYIFKPGYLLPASSISPTTTATNNQWTDEDYDVVNETKNPASKFSNINNSSKTVASTEAFHSNSIDNATVVYVDVLDAAGNSNAETSGPVASTSTQSSERLDLARLDDFTKLGEIDRQ